MMFRVKYALPIRHRKMAFFGKGAVHLLETTLVMEGFLPRIQLPLSAGLHMLYHRFLCGYTVRNVPYAVIDEHRPPDFVRWNHLLVFWMPNGSSWMKHIAAFRIEERARDEEFVHQLHVHVAVARSVQVRSAP